MVASSRKCPNCYSPIGVNDIHCGVCGALLDRDPAELKFPTASSHLIRSSSPSESSGLLQRRTVVGGLAGLVVGGAAGGFVIRFFFPRIQVQTQTIVKIVTPTPSPSEPPTNFSVTSIALKNGQVLPNEQPLAIPVSGVPLTITGTYTSQGSGEVWVLVEDIYGNYYLQHPSVRFGDSGQWTANNVVTAKGTTRINFVYVTSEVNKLFQLMVDTNNFGGFTPLPDGSKIIQTISIQVI